MLCVAYKAGRKAIKEAHTMWKCFLTQVLDYQIYLLDNRGRCQHHVEWMKEQKELSFYIEWKTSIHETNHLMIETLIYVFFFLLSANYTVFDSLYILLCYLPTISVYISNTSMPLFHPLSTCLLFPHILLAFKLVFFFFFYVFLCFLITFLFCFVFFFFGFRIHYTRSQKYVYFHIIDKDI